ncbi:MAG: GAF domain-containing protein [Chloroflexi bacterium]|nr:GAF domain-containing protein [Chloroflexota bacterium]
MWTETTPILIVMITANHRLATMIDELCAMLHYRFRALQDPLDDMEAITQASLIISDAVNEPEEIARARLYAVPPVVPVLWIVPEDEAASSKGQRVLASPFTVRDAISAIQRVLLDRTRDAPLHLTENFLYSLVLSSSTKAILEVMSRHITETLPCDRIGILTFDEYTMARWVYWHNAPDADVQQRLADLTLSAHEIKRPWFKTAFIAGDIVGVLIVHCSAALERLQETALRDIAATTAKVWVREMSLSSSHERIAEMQAFDLLGQAIVAQLDAQELMDVIVNSARMLVNAQGAAVWLHRDNRLALMARAGTPKPDTPTIALNQNNLLTRVLVGKQPRLIDGPQFTDGTYPEAAVRQALCVPLVGETESIGVVVAVNPVAHEVFTTEDEWRLRNLASWSVIAITNAHLHQQTQGALQRERAYRSRLIHTEKLTALGRLVASVAHEINNPLQIAQSCLDLTLANNRELTATTAENLHVVQDAIDQIGGVIQRIQSVYRVPDQRPRATDINALLRQVTEMVAHHMQQKQIALELMLDDTLPAVEAIPHELRQVFLNLLLNAIDALDADGLVSIRSDYVPDQDQLAVTVSDTGSGIPNDVLTSIFEPFFTTKADGSGLGLAVSQDIVKQYGGRITVSTRAGVGTSFIVWLPVAAYASAPAPLPAPGR